MPENISFAVDSDIYERFRAALKLSGEKQDEALETCLRWYIGQTFCSGSKEYIQKNVKKISGESKDFYGKALQRIPVWAMKPSQYNHKIIKAFFMAVDIAGEATLTLMERLCGNKERQDLFVPTFKNNYSQMKFDGAKSHGKVFEDDGNRVWIWSEIEDTLMMYKESFYAGEE